MTHIVITYLTRISAATFHTSRADHQFLVEAIQVLITLNLGHGFQMHLVQIVGP